VISRQWITRALESPRPTKPTLAESFDRATEELRTSLAGWLPYRDIASIKAAGWLVHDRPKFDQIRVAIQECDHLGRMYMKVTTKRMLGDRRRSKEAIVGRLRRLADLCSMASVIDPESAAKARSLQVAMESFADRIENQSFDGTRT
jgi:hypothetical protein